MDHQTPLSATADPRGHAGKGMPRDGLDSSFLPCFQPIPLTPLPDVPFSTFLSTTKTYSLVESGERRLFLSYLRGGQQDRAKISLVILSYLSKTELDIIGLSLCLLYPRIILIMGLRGSGYYS